MRGIATFVAWTFSAALFCAGLFFLLAATFFGASPERVFAAVGTGRTDAIIALLAFVFGTAATVAGAVATVYLTNLGLRLTQDTERREATRFAAEKFDEAVSHVTGVAAAVNELHVVAAWLLPALDAFAEGFAVPLHQLRETDLERLTRQHGDTALFAADAVTRLADAVEAAVRDDFTRFALARRAPAPHSSLPPEALGAPLPLHELPAAPARLRLAALRLRRQPAWRMVEARLVADAAASGGEGAPEGQNARVLLFAGALIDAWYERAPGASPHRVFVSGAAFLADLSSAAPDGQALMAAMREKYPDALPKRFSFPAAFDAASAFSPAFARTLAAARSLRALGLLQGPPPEP